MVAAVLYVPGRGRVVGPNVRTWSDAARWVEGYLKPGPLPTGATIHLNGRVYVPAGHRLREVGRDD